MNKWYRSNWIKALLVIVICISMSTIAICCITFLSGVDNHITWHDIVNNKTRSYPESEGFANTLNSDYFDIFNQLSVKNQLETDGQYDEAKIVDIDEFVNQGTISGQNESGFAYTIGQLVNWYQDSSSNVSNAPIYVVGKKPDNTYHYYTFEDFKQLILNGTLCFNISDHSALSNDDILNNLYNGVYTNDSTDIVSVIDNRDPNKANLTYSNCWTIDSPIAQVYSPQGADSILNIANNDPLWNGKLSDMLSNLDSAITNMNENVQDYEYSKVEYSEGNSNLTYLFLDKTNHKVYSNHNNYLDYEQAEKNINAMKKLGVYIIITTELKGFETNMNTNAMDWQQHPEISFDGQNTSTDYLCALAVDTSFPIQDTFYTSNVEYHTFMSHMIPMMIASGTAFIVFLIALVWLTLIAGRSSRTDNLMLHGIDKLWIEPFFCLVIGLWLLLLFGIYEIWSHIYTNGSYYITSTRTGAAVVSMIICGTSVTACFFLLGWLSFVRRIKCKSVWKHSLLRVICHCIVRFIHVIAVFFVDFWHHKRQTTKVIMISMILMLLHVFVGLRGAWDGWPILGVIFVDIAICIYLLHKIMIRDRIKEGIREVSEGNVTYHIDTSKMKGHDLEIATLVNQIGNGLHAAVDQSMKAERMKADLITNVSHDIKTPLTSIINYIGLLKREEFSDPKVLNYLEILEQKSQRLKTLTEDIVEASKASSGNITLTMMNLNFVEMLNQIEGEFIEKFESKNLSVITSHPETPVMIYADGRRLFRVLENIYGNAYKYAMEGTRIYADLSSSNEDVIFSLKNISDHALNISANELTERFIRGDVSRSTDGSGLGLSIAKDLTELQGGTFELYLDGDLFKVTITFPIRK